MDRYDPYTDKFLRDTQYNILGTNLAEVGTDCISRQQVIEALGELATFTEDWSCHTWMYTDDVYNAIKQLPPIQPEIVRCRECKFASGDSRICMKFDHSPIGELDFCSFAERREVNHESN